VVQDDDQHLLVRSRPNHVQAEQRQPVRREPPARIGANVVLQGCLAPARRLGRNISLANFGPECGVNDLPRTVWRPMDGGAQYLVVTHDLVEGLFQDRGCHGSAQPYRRGHI
jgi:hypothetical protein